MYPKFTITDNGPKMCFFQNICKKIKDSNKEQYSEPSKCNVTEQFFLIIEEKVIPHSVYVCIFFFLLNKPV